MQMRSRRPASLTDIGDDLAGFDILACGDTDARAVRIKCCQPAAVVTGFAGNRVGAVAYFVHVPQHRAQSLNIILIQTDNICTVAVPRRLRCKDRQDILPHTMAYLPSLDSIFWRSYSTRSSSNRSRYFPVSSSTTSCTPISSSSEDSATKKMP